MPFKGANLTAMESEFNASSQRGRIRVEQVFGTLKQLRSQCSIFTHDVYHTPLYLYSCCILHNLYLARGDPINSVGPEDSIDVGLYNRTELERGKKKEEEAYNGSVIRLNKGSKK